MSTVRLILTDTDNTDIKFDLPMSQIETATVIQYQGKFFSYCTFKWAQKEVHFRRCDAPLVLGRLKPQPSEVQP